MLASSIVAFSALLLPLALRVNAAPLEERDVNIGWSYGSEKIRGVNNGGVSDIAIIALHRERH
jgi:glucan 1,3-beta-glucosidase